MINFKDKTYTTFLLNEIEQDHHTELIPIFTDEQDWQQHAESNVKIPEELAILPILNAVLFPEIILPVTVSKKKSIKLIKKIYASDRLIGVLTQKNDYTDDPSPEDLYTIGTAAIILKMLTLPDGSLTIIIQGKRKIQIQEIIRESPYLTAKVNVIEEDFPANTEQETEALISSLKEEALKILRLNPEIPQDAQIALDNIESLHFLTNFLCSNINAEVSEKQKLLEINEGKQRAISLLSSMIREVQLLELKHQIQSKAHSDIEQQQRDYFLRHQIKVLQDELGYEAGGVEIEELRQRALTKKWSKSVAQTFEKELVRLQRANPSSPEYPISLNYIELLLELPWEEYTRDNLDLKRAKKILNAEHFGLEKVKERILEFLAVLKLKNSLRGPILCLYGPPGVGKTSLGKSIAKALDRKYVRMSLGGLHDEAEIRGHRKTYIGAMPGKIINHLKKAGSSNPVFILDEIDKVSSDFRGDPASALLEVLDPEQNNSFLDNYLEIEYDLSKVLFIATANSLDTIHPALRDRMEIIEITGYTLEEKLQIAKKHLLKKQLQEHGLTSKDVSLEESALAYLIENYTRESGVRHLERQVGSIIRKIAKSIALEESYNPTITPKDIIKLLGPAIFEKELYQTEEVAGIVTGLAWTPVGGEILLIEASISHGKGKLTLSGQLGEIMKESATAAMSYLRAHVRELGINRYVFEQFDCHVHVPAGAVPKDGPSAGITMLVALASVFTQRKVKERLAMTGEITLRGRVLPVGGIKEKILAAKRAGVSEVILPSKNQKDVDEIPKKYIRDIIFHYVHTVEEVLQIALLSETVNHPLDLSIQ